MPLILLPPLGGIRGGDFLDNTQNGPYLNVESEKRIFQSIMAKYSCPLKKNILIKTIR